MTDGAFDLHVSPLDVVVSQLHLHLHRHFTGLVVFIGIRVTLHVQPPRSLEE